MFGEVEKTVEEVAAAAAVVVVVDCKKRCLGIRREGNHEESES
jgi:hypothetical protein